jgi:outer membrane protein insertion porin family
MPMPRGFAAAAFVLLIAAPAAAQFGEQIVEVVVEQEGRTVTDPLVRQLIETTVGEPLSMRDVRETTEHLYNLRRFEDIRPTAEPVPGGVRLRYVLVPMHPVDRVEFRGMLGLERSELERLATDRLGRTPSAGRTSEVVDALRQTYRSRGYPSARITTKLEETHNPDRATLVFDIDAGRRARIAAVQVFQVGADEAQTILGAPDIKVGEPYDAEVVDARLREWAERLHERGYYEARASFGADIADDAYLRVNIARGPLVRVAFAGDPLPEDERDRLVPIRAEGSADEDLLEDAKIAVEDYLRQRGYRDAVANYTRTESAGELTITFTVTQGRRYVVDAVTVKGNEALTTDEIREFLGVERGDALVRSALQGRAAAIQNLYRSRGFTAATVVVSDAILPSSAAGGSRPVEVTLAIDEGPRTTVQSVTFTGNTTLSEAQLAALAATRTGAPYSAAEVATTREAIELEYRNRGYENVTVQPAVEAAEKGTRADIRYVITEGPQSIIDHIIIIGNERTRTETITNELLFREGDPLGYAALLASRARLAALGLFRRVEVRPLPHTGEARRDVLIDIEEADPTTLGYGGGVEGGYRLRTGDDGQPEERIELAPRGFFEIGRRNLWGKNRSVNLYTRVSLRSTDIAVVETGAPLEPTQTQTNTGFNEFRVVGTFREPRLFDTPAELLVTGIVEQAIRTTFNFSRRIVRAESGIRPLPGYILTGRYSFEKTKLFDERFTEEETPLLIDRIFPEVRLSKFAASLIRDTRDDLLDASRGTFLVADAEVAARVIGSEVGFVNGFVQASTYYQLPTERRLVFALSGRIGAARPFPREVPPVVEDGQPLPGETTIEELPASERYFAGGDTSVRGFSLDRLANEDTVSRTGFPLGGNSLVVVNSELRVNVTGPWQAVGFFDAGNVFRRAGDLDLTDLRPAAGIGLRYQAFGTIRLDWGFNLDRRELVPGRLERLHVLHVSLGQAF